MHVYLDEDVDVLLADLLGARGLRATITRDAGLLGKTDAEQLSFAASHGMAILTHNRVDFEKLHRQYLAAGATHSGILVAIRRRPRSLLANLLRLLNRLSADFQAS